MALGVAASVMLAAGGCGGDGDGNTLSGPVAQERPGPESFSDDAPSEDVQDQDPASAPAAPTPTLTPTEAVRRSIRAVLASGDPVLACERFASDRLLSEAFGGPAGCRAAAAAGGAANSVSVSSIRVGDGTAEAVATPAGGPSGGQRIEVGLVLADGTWLVDSLRSDVPVGP